jgi:predicted GNAT superfamily acetyltransferase
MTSPAVAVPDAAEVARAAGVELREVTDLAGFAAVRVLFDGIWRPDPGSPHVTIELLRALTKAGNYLAAAYQGSRMVGACVGFFGPPRQATMHSHIAGVAPELAGRGVGYALKLHQRSWALERGLHTITWTFDPLVSRNAYFNLVKLGAVACEYLPDFYGGMHDGINGGDETDRLLVRWDLDASGPAPVAADGAAVALDRAPDGGPVAGSLAGDHVVVAVPADVEALRAADPALARRWRTAVREALVPLLADGRRIVGFDKSGRYVLRRENR